MNLSETSRFRKIVYSTLSLITALTFNCATFTSYPEFPDKYEMVQNFKTPEKKKSLSITYKRILISDGTEIELKPKGIKKGETEMIDLIKSTGVFMDVIPESKEQNIQCEIIWEENLNSYTPLAMLSGFTLSVIPGLFENSVKLNMNFKNKKGLVIKGYERSVTYSTWVGWLLLPFMPFKFMFPEIEKGNMEIMKSILQEAMKDRII